MLCDISVSGTPVLSRSRGTLFMGLSHKSYAISFLSLVCRIPLATVQWLKELMFVKFSEVGCLNSVFDWIALDI